MSSPGVDAWRTTGTLAALRVMLAERLAEGWAFTLPAHPDWV